MILAATGHRPEKLGGYFPNPLQEWLLQRLREELTRLKPASCVSGMALGWDQWFARTCCDLDIPWTAAIPCDGQESRWPEDAQREYHALLRLADEVHVVSPGPYEAWKMTARNVWMVENSTHILACWNGSEGGTANCFRSAEARGRSVKDGTIILVQPKDMPKALGSEDPW
ncbi:MAG: SLOG family protein [Elusimicrobiota bacterium]|jgi:uncharacterized phage-like protein YoqJ